MNSSKQPEHCGVHTPGGCGWQETEPAPDGLREQYAAALRDVEVGRWNVGAMADAVMRVRDRRMEQLAAGRQTWKTKAEEIERDRDLLEVTLREVLDTFRQVRDDATRTVIGYISAPVHPDDADRWAAVLDRDRESS